MERPEDYTPPHELSALLHKHLVPSAHYKGGVMNETTRQQMMAEIRYYLEKLKGEGLIKPNHYPFTLEPMAEEGRYKLTWEIPVQEITLDFSLRGSDKPQGMHMPFLESYIRRGFGKENP